MNFLDSDCCLLQFIRLPPRLTEIERYAFYNSSLEYIQIPQNVQEIGEGVFSNCSDLKGGELNPKRLKL
jgi:hypothetical protein